MSNDEEYRRHAAECQRMAEGTRNEHDKSRWLKMAENWMRMVVDKGSGPQTSSGALRAFDEEQSEKGTGQIDSDSSH